MKTWVKDWIIHLINICMTIIITMLIVYFIFDKPIQAQISQKADTLLVNRAFQEIMFSMYDVSRKQDTIIKNQNKK
jgi:hypothetical protein